MKNKKKFVKGYMIALLSLVLVMQSTNVFAWSSHYRSHHYPRYSRSSCSPYYLAAPIFGGLTYLYYSSLANRERRRETTYIVMPSQIETRTVTVSPVVSDRVRADILVLNIPNNNGSYTRVELTKSGSGYVGPQGEYYEGHPTVDQLRVLYGE